MVWKKTNILPHSSGGWKSDIRVQSGLVPWASQMALVVKNPPDNAGDIRDAGSIHGSGRSPWRRVWLPKAVFLPRQSHGKRSLVGCNPWGRRVGHHWSNLAHRVGSLQRRRGDLSHTSLPASDGCHRSWAFLGLQLHCSSLPPSSHWPPLYVSLSLVIGIGFRAHLVNPRFHLKILNLITSLKALISNKVNLMGSSGLILGETTLHPTALSMYAGSIPKGLNS